MNSACPCIFKVAKYIFCKQVMSHVNLPMCMECILNIGPWGFYVSMLWFWSFLYEVHLGEVHQPKLTTQLVSYVYIFQSVVAFFTVFNANQYIFLEKKKWVPGARRAPLGPIKRIKSNGFRGALPLDPTPILIICTGPEFELIVKIGPTPKSSEGTLMKVIWSESWIKMTTLGNQPLSKKARGLLVFQAGYHPHKRTFKHTLSMYFPGMKIDPKYVFLHAFILIFPSCPFQNWSTWPKTHPFLQFCTFLHP